MICKFIIIHSKSNTKFFYYFLISWEVERTEQVFALLLRHSSFSVREEHLALVLWEDIGRSWHEFNVAIVVNVLVNFANAGNLAKSFFDVF